MDEKLIIRRNTRHLVSIFCLSSLKASIARSLVKNDVCINIIIDYYSYLRS